MTKWKFPNNVPLVRFEIFTIGTIALFILVLGLIGDSEVLSTILGVVLFVVLYGMVSILLKLIHKVEEHYHITPTHFHILRKSRFKHKKEKIHWKDIIDHRIDDWALAGTLLTRKGSRHTVLFKNKTHIKKVRKKLKKR